MTDKKDQTSSDNTTPKYRALVDGSDFLKQAIFRPIDDHGLYGELAGNHFYKPSDGRITPVFHCSYFENNPNFELVKEYWEPGAKEPFYAISGDEVLSLTGDTGVIGVPIFRTDQDAHDCIKERDELIKKRSKESRRLDADTKAD